MLRALTLPRHLVILWVLSLWGCAPLQNRPETNGDTGPAADSNVGEKAAETAPHGVTGEETAEATTTAEQGAGRAPADETPGEGNGEGASSDEVANNGAAGDAENGANSDTGAEAPQELSEAEKIARAKRGIEDVEKHLAALREKLQAPESEYNQAEKAFQELDETLEAKKGEIRTLEEAGKQTAKAEEELAEIEEKWKLARRRFDLAIEERKALKEQIPALEDQIRRQKEVLARLRGEDDAEDAEAAKTADAATGGSAAGATGEAALAKTSAKTTPETPPAKDGGEAAPAEPEEAASAAGDGPTGDSQTAAAPDTVGEDAVEEGAEEKPKSEGQIGAEKVAAEKAEAAEAADEEVKSLDEQIEAKNKEIETERKLLQTARQRVELASETRQSLEAELAKKRSESAPSEEIEKVREEITGAATRFREANLKARRYSDRLSELQTELSDLQSQKLVALQEAETKREEAEQAQEDVEAFTNPFSPQNLLEWLLVHGLKILFILIGIFLALFIVRTLGPRFTALLKRAGGKRGSDEERESRAQTLVGVFQNVARVVLIAAAFIMILQEMAIPIGPILGGAAVLGLAAAFGAQKLIRDYFHGFVILIENQYGVNDVIRIAGIAGLVERVTLRMTVLRDLEGAVHFVPNGEILTVTNMTHGWSRALFEVGVAYRENADRVMEVIREMGADLRNDPYYGPLILEDLTMLGVDAMADSAIIIKFFIKTRPLKQWEVKREVLRRLKARFDELGIEIPFPHRTLYHRFEPGAVPPELAPSRLGSNGGD